MNTEPNAFPSILIQGMGWVSFVLSSDSAGFVSYAGSLGSVPSSQILDCKGARKEVVVGPWLLAWICSKFPNLYIAKEAKKLVHSQ